MYIPLGGSKKTPLQNLSDGQWYLAWERSMGHRDHQVLFYGIGESIDHAKRADILFLGNSRTQVGFSSEVLTEFFASRGLRFFNLSFGHGEMDAFPLLIIKKFDLRPKWIVVNVEHFFTGDLSAFAQQILPDHMHSGNPLFYNFRWEEIKNALEVKSLFAWQKYTAVLFPYFPVQDGIPSMPQPVLYRSSLHGSWLPLHWPNRNIPIRPQQNRAPKSVASQVFVARVFLREMQQRGTNVVLTLIPSPENARGEAHQLAEALGVPLIAPVLQNLTTTDGSHLSPESARRFSEFFLNELEKMENFHQ